MRLNQLLPAAMFLAILTAQWGTPGGYRSHPGHGPGQADRQPDQPHHPTGSQEIHPPSACFNLAEWTGPARNNPSEGPRE